MYSEYRMFRHRFHFPCAFKLHMPGGLFIFVNPTSFIIRLCRGKRKRYLEGRNAGYFDPEKKVRRGTSLTGSQWEGGKNSRDIKDVKLAFPRIHLHITR